MSKMLDSMFISATLDKWFTGKELVKLLDGEIDKIFKERYIINDLMNYLKSGSKELCALHGLRRTGKSVLLRQAMRRLIYEWGVSPEQIAYITFSIKTKCNDDWLVTQIRDLKNLGVKCFFIDEISYIVGDYEETSLNLLADELVDMECRIVLTGTVSYAINLLMNKVLLDRVKVIDSNYFSFKEANEVLGYDIYRFVDKGGCIGDAITNNYIKSFVVDNVVDSVMKSEKLYEMAYFIKRVDDVIANDREVKNILSILFIRIVDFYTRVHLYKSIKKESFTYSDIGRLKSVIEHKSELINKDDQSFEVIKLPVKEYCKKMEESLGSLAEFNIDETYFKELLKILEFIGLIEPIRLDNYYGILFLNNSLRYRLCKTIVEELCEDVNSHINGYFSFNIALDTIRGIIFENIIDLDLKRNGNYIFDKYRSTKGFEIDLIIEDEYHINLYEVQFSDKVIINQVKNLVNLDFIKEIEASKNKTVKSYNVIYNGGSTIRAFLPEDVFRAEKESVVRPGQVERWSSLEDMAKKRKWKEVTVNYINATDFLCNL